MRLKIGYKASAEQFGPSELARSAVLAEEVGFDSVFVSDHVQPWRERGGHAPAALPWLGWVAARTERVVLGTSVLTPTFRYHPGVLAAEVATLAGLAPGRVVLGVGTGEALNEAVMGVLPDGWPKFAERMRRLAAAVDLMRRLWAGERVSADGGPWPVRDLRLYDPPPEPIPVWVAGGGPKIAAFAGRVGDGFIATSGKGRDLYADELLPAVAAGLAERAEGAGLAERAEGIGRAESVESAEPGARSGGGAPTTYERMLELKVSYDPDPAQALENCRFWAPLSLPAETKHSLGDPAAMEAAADALPVEEVARRWVVASAPEEVVAAARRYVELGFSHLVVHGPGADQERFLRCFARDCLPSLRDLRVAS